jgi:hypothetical protein
MSSRTKLRHAAAVAVGKRGRRVRAATRPERLSTRITNRYFPLPVGRADVQGVEDGESVRETVTVTSGTWLVAAGITARVVHDVLTTTDGRLREQTDDFYAQDDEGNVWELLKGEAGDTAWIVDRGRSLAVPYGIVRNVLTSLEATEVEPGSYDEKVYARGLGIVRERSLTSNEHLELVNVTV